MDKMKLRQFEIEASLWARNIVNDFEDHWDSELPPIIIEDTDATESERDLIGNESTPEGEQFSRTVTAVS